MKDASDVSVQNETLKGTSGKVVTALGKFLASIAFARLLGPSGFGAVYLVFRLSTIIIRPAIGWGDAARKRFSEGLDDRPTIVGAQITFNLAWLGIATVAVFAFADRLVAFTGLLAAPLLLTLSMLYESFERTFLGLVSATGRVGASSWLKTLRVYLTIPVQLWFVLAGLGAAGMIYGRFVSAMVVLFFVYYYLSVRPTIPGIRTVRNLWSFARYSIPTALFGTLYENLDVVILGVVLSTSSAGLYEAAWKLTLPAIFLAEAGASSLMAKVSADRAKDRQVTEVISDTIGMTSIVAVPLFFGGAVVSDELIRVVYGAEYDGAGVLLVGIAFYQVILSQSKPLLQTLYGLNRPKVTMRLSMLAILINVVVGVTLSIRIGPVGVVVSTILAESIRFVGASYTLKRWDSSLTLFTRPFRQQLLSGASMALVLLVVRYFVAPTSLVAITGIVSTGAILYVGMLVTLSKQMRDLVRGLFPLAL